MSSITKHKETDSDLWLRFLGGDEKAFALIFEDYFDVLHRYGSAITSHKEVIEDSIQDIFIELWNSRSRLKPTDSIKFYLFKVLRRKIYRNLDIRMDLYEDVSIAIKEHETSIENILIEKETATRQNKLLAQEIKSLSSRQREVIELRFFQGFSYEKIAELSEINLQSVHNNVHRALTNLREKLPGFFQSLLVLIYISK
jgi:RNA polymerase sigma factor (sigma-70 family)